METLGNDRVRKNTPRKFNREIDDEILLRIEKLSNNRTEISQRITELDREWDIERYLALNMSIASLTGILLSLILSPYWIALTIVVLLFFIQHAVQGWCPPLPVFRYKKIRTKSEIDLEKYALKALRGDFQLINDSTPSAVLEATRKN